MFSFFDKYGNSGSWEPTKFLTVDSISNGNRTEWSTIRHEVLLPINHKNYNFREKKNTKVWKGKIYIKSFYTVSMVIETKVVIGWFKLQLKMWLLDLNYKFECDWLIELSDNNLTSELLENSSF